MSAPEGVLETVARLRAELADAEKRLCELACPPKRKRVVPANLGVKPKALAIAADKGAVTAAEVQAATGCAESTARASLSKLASRGRLERREGAYRPAIPEAQVTWVPSFGQADWLSWAGVLE